MTIRSPSGTKLTLVTTIASFPSIWNNYSCPNISKFSTRVTHVLTNRNKAIHTCQAISCQRTIKENLNHHQPRSKMSIDNQENFNQLTISTTNHIAVVTINCPPNVPLDLKQASEIRAVCQFIEDDSEIQLALFRGTGNHFCSGRLLMPEEIAKGTLREQTEWIETMQVADYIAKLSIPVVIAINGNAIDHGLELALSGDIRIADPDIQLGLTDIKHGVMGWDGGTQRLPRLVGQSWANDLVLTGRTISAQEALNIGLVNRVSLPGNLIDESLSLAESITEGGPIASKYLKETMYKGMDMTLPQGLALEADLNVILQSTKDRAEGISSFLQKRKPLYNGE